MLKLGPSVLTLLFLAALLWRTDLAATAGLFQSPAPKETPTDVPTEVATLPPSPTATAEPATPIPTPTPVPVATETATEVPTLPMEPTHTQEPPVTPTLTTPMPPAPSPTEPLVTATSAPPTAVPEPSVTAASDRERYAEGESTLRFDWGVLFDSLALGLSYVWLCCGVLLFLCVPGVFVVLWVANKRRRQIEE